MDREDIYLAAQLLVEQYGPSATAQAKENVDAFLARGDVESAMGWKRVLRAILELQPSATKH